MEADEYFQAYDALEKDKHKSRIALRIGNTCGITQIIWSSFDYMTGPELRFVWDVTPSNESLTPINLSGDEETGSGADDESLDSSMTNSSVQFEEIDDVLQTDLSILDDAIEGNLSISRFLDDYMNESRESEAGTIDALTDSFASSAHVGLPLDESTDSFDSLKTQEHLDVPLNTMDGSSPIEGRTPNQSVSFDNIRESSQSTITCSTRTSAKSRVDSDNEEHDKTLFDDDTDLLTSGYIGSEMIESNDDLPFSPFSMTSSTRRDYPDSNPINTPFSIIRPQSPSSSTSSDIFIDDVTLDTQDDVPSDEKFIAKYVLAEQICSTQLSSNPLIHKLTIVSSRRILVSSFLFSAPNGHVIEKGMHALSFVMNHKRSKWYMDRHSSIESMIVDIVPKMKASLLVEDLDDTVVRLTSEWSRILSVLGSLERFPLIPSTASLKIKRTFFSTPSLPSSYSSLISKSISGCLQSQGNCVLIGSNISIINRLLHTLLLFIPSSLRWCCLRPYSHEYSHHIRLQAVKKSSLPTVLSNAVNATWPTCIIDVDRDIVLISNPYPKHATNKRRSDLLAVNRILGDAPDSTNRRGRGMELSKVKSLDCVVTFLRRIALLPVDDSVRLGFVDQFNLCVENAARALIAYVKDASEPSPSDKSHASKSSKFSLITTRKALDLTNEGWFQCVLACAELLQPEITQFIYM